MREDGERMRGRRRECPRVTFECVDAERGVRPRRPERDPRKHHWAGIRVHEGAEEHALARHGRLPLHVRYLVRIGSGVRSA
jgi:hypothetical protein